MDKPTKQKYNLHYKIRKQGYQLKTADKTILVKFDAKAISKQAKRLVDDFGYEVQFYF